MNLLLKKGANVDAKDKEGRTSLLYAATSPYLVWKTRGKDTEVTNLLLKKGADINAKDNGGRTPLL